MKIKSRIVWHYNNFQSVHFNQSLFESLALLESVPRVRLELILQRNRLQMNPVIIRNFWHLLHLLFALVHKNQLEANRKRNSQGHVVNTAHHTWLPQACCTKTKRIKGIKYETWSIWRDSSIIIAFWNHVSFQCFWQRSGLISHKHSNMSWLETGNVQTISSLFPSDIFTIHNSGQVPTE